MARRLNDEHGRVVWVDFSRAEFARSLKISEQQLADWQEVIPHDRIEDGEVIYRFASHDDLRLARMRAGVLRTKMSIEALANVEAQGMLEAYYKLSLDCPEGLTAHVYRSYVVLLVVQQKTGLMLDAAALAERANLNQENPETGKPEPSEEFGRKHLRLLQAVGILEHGGERWEFSHVPLALRGGSDE